MSISAILIAVSVVCFALMALSLGGHLPLLPIGLAFFAAGHLPFGSISRA